MKQQQMARPYSKQKLLYTTAFAAMLCVFPRIGCADPTGGTVTSGSATIQSAPSQTIIHQSTDRAIIRWNSFDLGSGDTVQFKQPSSSSITVNRIMDTKASQIDGHISANGNIVLINPNGVVFGAGSTVDVGGLVATSSDLSDDNEFMNGGTVRFSRPGNADAQITNNGSITVHEGGLVGLVAPHVENNGVISARLGKVHLAAGDIHTIDFAGDGLIQLEVSENTVNQSVKNTGTITADGGTITLTAASARHIVNSLITNTGTLQAKTVTMPDNNQKQGQVFLSTNGLNGLDLSINPEIEPFIVETAQTSTQSDSLITTLKIENSGNILVDGDMLNELGGVITLLADQIVVGDGSVISASGDSAGGDIRIGGEYQGSGNLPTSKAVFITEHVILNASARRQGKGGRVILWSDENTFFYGDARVSGGVNGGDGGFIEISGKKYLDFQGTVDLKSYDGEVGVLLLDPTNITISTGSNANVNASNPFSPTADDVTSVLNITTLQTALASGSVIVQTRATGSQSGDITLSNALTWSSGSTLTLIAHNDIILNSTISAASGKLVLTAGRSISASSNLSFGGTVNMTSGATGSIALTGTLSSTALTIASNGGNIITGGMVTMAGNSTITSGGGTITIGAGGLKITNYTLGIDGGTTGQIIFNGILDSSSTTLSRTITLTTDADIALNVANALTGSSSTSLVIQTSTANHSIGLGTGQGGDINFTDTELTRFKNGWSRIDFGSTTQQGDLNVGNFTLADAMGFYTDTGTININGALNTGSKNISLTTNTNIGLPGSISTTGTLTIAPTTDSTSIGLGTGQTGTISFTDADVTKLSASGASTIQIGSTTMTGTMNVGAASWSSSLKLYDGLGIITINGTQTMAAGKALTITTNADLALNANLSGTGTLIIFTLTAGSGMGVGTGQTGGLQLSDAELAHLADGWSSITFGSTYINVGAWNWNDTLKFNTNAGGITINGTTTLLGVNDSLTFQSDQDITFNADLVGTGSIIIVPSNNSDSIALGTGLTADVAISTASLAHIISGWSAVTVGSSGWTSNISLGNFTANTNIIVRSSTGTVTLGNLNMGANDLIINTNTDLVINNTVTGTGTFTIAPNTGVYSIGIGSGQTGTISLDDSEIGYINNTWNTLVFGNTSMATTTGTINAAAINWNSSVMYQTLTGEITIHGAQDFGTHNLTIYTNADPTILGNLSGSGSFQIYGQTGATIAVGDGQTGGVSLSNQELSYILNGWDAVYFGEGSSGADVAINIGSYNFQYDTYFRSDAANITVNGAITTQNNLTFETNQDLVINADITGTGIFTVRQATIAATRKIALGTSVASSIYLDTTELDHIQNGWQQLVFGRGDQTNSSATTTIGAYAWNDNVEFLTGAGAITLSGNLNAGNNNVVISSNANPVITGTLTGTGNLIFKTSGLTTAIGLAGATGTYNLSAAELNQITDGWNSITFGSDLQSGNILINAYTWKDNVIFMTRGTLDLKGIQSSNASVNMTFVNHAGIFKNSTGNATPIAPGASGRYLVYSVSAAANSIGTMTLPTVVSGETYYSYAAPSTGNYMIYSTGSSKIIYLQIDNTLKIYGDDLPTFTYSYVGGLQGSDTLASVITAYSLNAAGTAVTDNTGTTSSITGSFTTALGYTVNVTNGTLTVIKAPTLVYADVTRAYGDANPTNSLTYTGLKNGETSSVIDSAPTYASGPSLTDTIGTYAATLTGGSDNNYVFNYNDGTVAVTKAVLTATAQDAARDYGDANPALSIVYTGFKNGETSTVIDTAGTAATAANATSNAGTYAITASGASDNNYSFSYVDGTLTIDKAVLNITADDNTRAENTADPVLSASYTGFKNSENTSVIDVLATLSTTATLASTAGSYVITASGASDNNYSFTYTPGTLLITAGGVPSSSNSGSSAVSSTIPVTVERFISPLVDIRYNWLDTIPVSTQSALPLNANLLYNFITVNSDLPALLMQKDIYMITISDSVFRRYRDIGKRYGFSADANTIPQ